MKKVISWVLRKVPRPVLQRISVLPLKITTLFLRGNQKACPVCGKTYRKMLPYGRLHPRENALCPNCLALERHRLMYLYLKEQTDFFTAPHRVLHIAPEHCFIGRFERLPNLTEYVTADLVSPLAKVKMDIHAMPFADNSFDVIFCNHVLEHVDDYPLAIREMYRVLRPGGWGIMQSPQDWSRPHTFEDATITEPAERERVFWQNDHLRLFGRDYGQVLAAGGFQVTEDDFVKKLPPERVQRYALPPDEVIYFCRKAVS